MSEQVKIALEWIKHIIDGQKVPYQIVGGLAAKIHGGSRAVVDIDLYIPKIGVKKILSRVETFISKPLAHYKEGCWDLEYFQLIYKNQKIEIGLSPGTKILEKKSGKWVELQTSYKDSLIKNYCGIDVPVIPIADLIAYKAILDRKVDRIDIRELTKQSRP